MNIIDISWPVTGDITTYKDRDDVALSDKDVRYSFHTGTHVDAPIHFVDGGKTIDQIDLSCLHGPCRVIDMTHVLECVTKKDLESCAIQRDEIIIFKTTNSDLPATGPFEYNFIYLDAPGAQYLANCGVKSVGIDYLGIERSQPDHATHVALLKKEILIIEGLRLAHVKPGRYIFTCFPLALQDVDAAPARAVIWNLN